MYVVGEPPVGVDDVWIGLSVVEPVFSSTVPSGSGAFQMPTRPLGGGRGNLKNASVTFSHFFGMKLLWDAISNIS